MDPEALGSWYICLRNEYFLWEIYKCLYEPFGLMNFHIERILRVTFFRRWSFLPTKSSSRGSPKIKTSNCYFLVKYIKFCKKNRSCSWPSTTVGDYMSISRALPHYHNLKTWYFSIQLLKYLVSEPFGTFDWYKLEF